MDFLYHFLKNYVALCLFFYHKKIKTIGKENTPKKGAVLFISNHPNALLDPLLIVTNNVRDIYFLSRASAFKKKLVARFLNNIHMLPIYRKRDGANALGKNKPIFKKSVELMKDGKTLYIAAEGNHNVKRRIRELKKGFVHLILNTFSEYPELDIQIVPVGLNYDSVLKYPSSVSVYYGKPINAKDYYDKNDDAISTKQLLKVVKNGMKKTTNHIEDEENYDAIIGKLKALNVDFLNPDETNKIIENIDNHTVVIGKLTIKKNKNLFYYIFIINSLFPWMIWKKLKRNIKEQEFISTSRFAIGATLFPIFYIIQSLIIYYFFGTKIAFIYFGSSILLGLISARTSKV